MIKAGQDTLDTDFIINLVAGEALSARDAVYISTADGKAYKCDADDVTKLGFVGFAQEAVSSGATLNIVHSSQMTGFSSLTIGATYYISGTAGAITSTAPNKAIAVGVALSASVIKIKSKVLDVVPSVQSFSSSGTWNKPGYGTMALIEVWAGGGSGGSRTTTGLTGGGAGGGYNSRIIPLSSLGETETVTIGDGGVGVSGNSNGNPGGNTSFGSYVSAYGGGAGQNDPATVTGGTGGGSIAAEIPTTPISGAGGTNAAGGHGELSGGGAGGNFDGGKANKGGGGGAGTNSGSGAGAGGTSVNGGAGGAGNTAGSATAGSVPGGGGGGSNTGTSGAGGKGQARVVVF